MIGHFLLTLTAEQEDRVLTQVMRPGDWDERSYGGPCLLGTVHPQATRPEGMGNLFHYFGLKGFGLHSYEMCSVASQYDSLCFRFGAPRVNAAIRNRILSDRARRELAPRIRETVVGASAVGVGGEQQPWAP